MAQSTDLVDAMQCHQQRMISGSTLEFKCPVLAILLMYALKSSRASGIIQEIRHHHATYVVILTQVGGMADHCRLGHY